MTVTNSSLIIPNLSTPPELDRFSAGFMYWNYAVDKAYIWQGTYWEEILGGTGSIQGTINRIDVNGIIIDISPNYIGQASINTLGTITGGTWNGTAIIDDYIVSSSYWDNKLDETVFNIFTGTTLPYFYYNKIEVDGIITGITASISTKLDESVFNTFTGTTLPYNYYNKTEIDNTVSGLTISINSKQDQLNGLGFIKASGTTISYDNNVYYLDSNPNNYITLSGITSTATGLTYNNLNGEFSLTNDYIIPTTTEQSNWNTAYNNRIISLTITGDTGSATLISNVLNIPTYSITGLGGQPLNSNLSSLTGLTYSSVSFVKMTGVNTFSLDTNTYYNSTNPSNYISLSGITSTATGLDYNNITGVFSLASGYIIPSSGSTSNWDIAYSNRITSLTVTGNSGASTLLSNVLNIPTYSLVGLGGQPLNNNLSSLTGLTYSSTSFVKMTGANTFSLDTNIYIIKAGDTGIGNLTFNNNTVLDVVASAGTDVLNIGTGNADTINIGYAGSTVNINGILSYQYTDNLQVKDKLITLNKGGGIDSGVSSGFEIEENTVIKGWFTTSSGRNGWEFRSPAIGYSAILSQANLTAERTYTLPNVSGTLSLTSDLHVAVSLAANSGLELNTQTLNMGTPSTITSTSTNIITGSTHNHAITPSLGFIGNGSALNQILITGNSLYTPVWTLASNIVSLNSLNYSSVSFVKMTGANTFSLDTNVYATSSDLSTHAGLTTTAHGLGGSAFHTDDYYQIAGSYAPASGSANYIQNQIASVQTANMWINGSVKGGRVIIDNGSTHNYIDLQRIVNKESLLNFISDALSDTKPTWRVGYDSVYDYSLYNFSISTYGGAAVTPRLTITPTGAATFASIVSATRFTSSTTDGLFFKSYNDVSGWQIGSDAQVGAGMYIYHESGYYAFKLSTIGDITSRTLVSTVTTGTAPFTVASTTVVTNLNADTVDSYHYYNLVPISVYNTSSTTSVIYTSIASNNYSMFHGIINIVEFNGGRNSEIKVSGTVNSTGALITGYATSSGYPYIVTFFNSGGYICFEISGLFLYSTISAFITSNAYQNYLGVNKVANVNADSMAGISYTNNVVLSNNNITTGTGTTNYIPKWTGSSTLGNSNLYYSNGSLILSSGVSASSPTLGSLTGISHAITYDGAWGTTFGLDMNYGYGWIQQQRIDGTATAYNLSLQPSGGNVGIGYSSGTEITNYKLSVNGSGYFNGVVETAGKLIAGTGIGFRNSAYQYGLNPIWSFNNAEAYGLSYYQANSDLLGYGSDGIGFHFGNTSAPPFFVLGDGRIRSTATTASTSTSTGALVVAGGIGVGGAINADTITANTYFNHSINTDGQANGLSIRNTSGGLGAICRIQIGNSIVPYAFTIDNYGTGHATLPYYTRITNQHNAPLQLGGYGNVTIGLYNDGKIGIANNDVTSNFASGLYWNGTSDNVGYSISRTKGLWSDPNYQQLQILWNTGIIIDGGSVYGKSGTVLQPNGGNVGIGRYPSWTLDINGILSVETAGNSSGLGNVRYVARFVPATGGGGIGLCHDNTLTRGYISSSGTDSSIGFITNVSNVNYERMTIDSTGTISTNTNIARKLVINSSVASYVAWQAGGADQFYIGNTGAVSGTGGTGYDIWSHGHLRFFVNSVSATPAVDIAVNNTVSLNGDVYSNNHYIAGVGRNLYFETTGGGYSNYIGTLNDYELYLLCARGTANSLRLSNSGGAIFSNHVTIQGTTASSSTTTGALVVAGGLGVGGNLYGVSSSFTSNISLGIGTSGSTATPSVIYLGNNYSNGYTRDQCKIYLYNNGAEQYGFSVGPVSDVQYHSNGKHDHYIANTLALRLTSTTLNIQPTTASSSYTTGSLIVSGGVGIAGAIFTNSNITTAGSGTFTGGGFNSLRSMKTIHKDWKGSALNEIAKFKMRDFNYNTQLDYNRSLGFIIDEIPTSISEYVLHGEDKSAINLYSLHGLSFKAHQETKSEIEILKEKIIKLEKEIILLKESI